MSTYSKEFVVQTQGKGTYEVTSQVEQCVNDASLDTGTVTVFVQHTSASLVIMENADPSARTDLEAFFDHLVPEDTPYFIHTYEGPDDMPSHIRMALTRTSEVIPIIQGKMALGTWQGIFLFEHRRSAHSRRLSLVIQGE